MYFKNLDNNAGVFHRLIDDAEEEEFKEAMLAYYFLISRPDIKTLLDLDHSIESWLRDEWQASINFEVSDAVSKLITLGLVELQGEKLIAASMPVALSTLDKTWDEYFPYSTEKELD